MYRTTPVIAALAMVLGLGARAGTAQKATDPHAGHRAAPAPAAAGARDLPPVPENLPGWLNNTNRNHIFYRRGRYNFDVYNLPKLARDLNAVAVGHAMAYEDLVTGKAAQLETKTFERINRVLKNPPKFMPDEAAISPTFGRRYGVLEQVFDWTHVLHGQTVDVLASKQMTEAEKDREIERLWKYYFESVPYAINPLPMNMDYLYSLAYSQKFRNTYPKVNGLFWGYHWLQGAMYDMLYRASPEDQKAAFALLGEQYHQTELYRTDRPFMPMFAEVSPVFSARFPHIANAFDNLHMLHDMVNDILATEWMTERQKEEQIRLAIWMVSAEAHRGEKPGSTSADRLHDHRHFNGMPGMGMMRGMTPELMWMPAMGWMSMADCHHCSMPLWEGKDWWRNPTVTADGWSMRVRCPLCARDMSAETKGRAMLRIPTENPDRVVVVIGDEQGNLKTSTPGVVFLEREGSHAGCDEWSRAFSSRAAFDAYVQAHPELSGAKALSFEEWAQLEGKEPDTYVKPKGPVENPYAPPATPRGEGSDKTR
jgi:hypothetical protein